MNPATVFIGAETLDREQRQKIREAAKAHGMQVVFVLSRPAAPSLDQLIASASYDSRQQHKRNRHHFDRRGNWKGNR